jgi:regulatory protein
MTEDRRQNLSAPAKASRTNVMNTAVRILANRDHSKYELKRKLQQRGFASKSISTVMVECERFGYIDDKRTARVYILQLKRKCFGKRYIQQALKKKRLSGAAIEKILSENYPGVDEYEHAGRLLEKKMRTFARETDPKKRSDKIYRFLYSRGFSPAVISELIRNLDK